MKSNVNAFWIGILLSAIIFIFAWLLMWCFPDQYAPEDGVWYCKELLLQLSYEPGSTCFVVEDGQAIVCACGSDRGSKWIYVFCQDAEQSKYHMGELLFSMQIVSLNDTELVVVEENANHEYVFRRIG